MKQPTHFFNLESTKNNNGNRLIYFNLNYGYKEYDPTNNRFKYIPMKISTQWSIKEEHWMGKPNYRANSSYVRKFGKDINNILDKIEKLAYDQLSIYRNTHEAEPTPDQLKKIVLEKIGRIEKSTTDKVIIDYITLRVDDRTTTNITSEKRWNKETGKQYTNLKNHIINYQNKKGITLTFGKLNGELFMDFFKVINEIYKEESGENYAHNTIAKENKHFRALLKDATDNNIKVGFNFRKSEYFIKERAIKNEIFLTEEQLQTIINTDVRHSKELTHAKNYIIISSFTGLRIGDMIFLNELEPENQIYESKKYYCFTTRIRKSQENKDELISTIPILKPVKKLLSENNNEFPKFTSKPNIRKCIKKLLIHLKFENKIVVKKHYYLIDNAVIEKEKLQDIFSPHDCRSTFITNLKNLGIHDEDIEPITHPKLKNTSIIQTYDKTNLTSKAVNLIKAINSKQSKLYRYT
jgi:integrase